jgi:hypothetical protein
MGFALWIDEDDRMAWAQGTQEYRPMGAGAIALTAQFRRGDFHQTRALPPRLTSSFAGFFGSLEDVNRYLRTRPPGKCRSTPAYLR